MQPTGLRLTADAAQDVAVLDFRGDAAPFDRRGARPPRKAAASAGVSRHLNLAVPRARDVCKAVMLWWYVVQRLRERLCFTKLLDSVKD